MPKRLLLSLIAVLSGCSLFRGEVSVYVDNGSTDPIEVSVDGGSPVPVAAGGVGTLKMTPGARRIVVRRRGEVVYDETRTLQVDAAGASKYVLNPDRTRRYVVAWVSYRRPGYQARSFDPVGDALQHLLPVEPGPWLKGAHHAVLGETLPETIQVKQGDNPAPRSRVCRVPPSDYDLLVAARKQGHARAGGDELVAAVQRASACL